MYPNDNQFEETTIADVSSECDRTESEDKEKREIDLYGANAKDWLNRWDEGRSVWSISMGGLGPGYEQVIQITTAEILRCLLAKSYDHASWSNDDAWKKDLAEIEAVTMPTISGLGLSGAQWGAALNLACHFYQRGSIAVMTDERVKDRHIQVQRTFPVLENR